VFEHRPSTMHVDAGLGAGANLVHGNLWWGEVQIEHVVLLLSRFVAGLLFERDVVI